ncbi:MAG: hypothetical protein G01um101470_764 [Parcubacteria group bacterium Gr01-1014_70]|nr:MAG: hypothetical protein G01um101470_764 [Parcubacteria group bacterium Gr01-1014_70]
MKSKKKRTHRIFTGDALADTMGGMANAHYGYYYKITAKGVAHDLKKWMRLYDQGKKPRLSTTKKEREELAKKPFEFYGIVFESRDEVHAVVELFKKRFGNKRYSSLIRKSFKNDLGAVLGEVRHESW